MTLDAATKFCEQREREMAAAMKRDREEFMAAIVRLLGLKGIRREDQV